MVLVLVFGLGFVVAGVLVLTDYRQFGTKVVSRIPTHGRAVPSLNTYRKITGVGYVVIGGVVAFAGVTVALGH